MKLYSGMPIWFENCHPPTHSELTGNLRCQVAIVGGGVTGALLASQFMELGMDVSVFDRQIPGIGSTAASTGLLIYETDQPLLKLAQHIGVDAAARVFQLGYWAIAKIESLVNDLNLQCGFRRCNSMYAATNYWQGRQLYKEYLRRRDLGLDVSYLSGNELRSRFGIRRPGAIVSKNCGQINPLKFTTQLLSQLKKRGANVFQNAEVTGVHRVGSQYELSVGNFQIQADRVIYATGYEAPRLAQSVPNRLRTTYVAVSRQTSQKPGWPSNCIYWEMGRPYFYARETENGRLLIGGQDTSFANDHRRGDMLQLQTRKVLKQFHRIFSEASFELDRVWAGTFAESQDGLPYIGQAGNERGIYVAMGYGGNGITFAAIAAKVIAGLILGKPEPEAQIFRLDR